MGRPAKKPVTSSNGARSVPVQTDSSAKNQNKSSAAAPTEEEDIIIESAPAQSPEESNMHEQTAADENLQTNLDVNKQTRHSMKSKRDLM